MFQIWAIVHAKFEDKCTAFCVNFRIFGGDIKWELGETWMVVLLKMALLGHFIRSIIVVKITQSPKKAWIWVLQGLDFLLFFFIIYYYFYYFLNDWLGLLNSSIIPHVWFQLLYGASIIPRDWVQFLNLLFSWLFILLVHLSQENSGPSCSIFSGMWISF